MNSYSIAYNPAYSKSFNAAVANTLGYEGGLTEDQNDPGGVTNWGISQRSYPSLNIATLTQNQAVLIYFDDFWKPIHGDSMPKNLAMNVFDCGVNCGVGTAIEMLQRAIGVIDDGIIGPKTLVAMKNATIEMVKEFVALRIKYYESLKEFPIYGDTWIARANGTLATSLSS